MRCEGAENPPCKRCRQQSLECLFEKPNREATLTGEAGLERIRSLETHVAEIRQSQSAIQSVLADIAAHLRVGSASVRSPSAFPPYLHHSPAIHADSPASMSTPISARPQLDMGPPTMTTPQPGNPPMYPSPTMRPNGDSQTSQMSQGSPAYQQYPMPPGGHPPMLPPISSMESTGPRPQHDNVSSVRHQYAGNGHARHFTISTATSAESSDVEEDAADLPSQGLTAPWEVLRSLADVAIQKAAKASRRHPVYDLCRSFTFLSAGKW
jgi:hypothetical protein